MSDGHLVKAALELAQAINEVADEQLPDKLAGIVKTHAGIAVASALIPIPGADLAAAAANIWTMYARINGELNLPFKENIIKSVAAGVLTNIGGAVIGSVAIGTALKLIPGLGSVGGAAVMAATVYGVTIVSGIVYMKAIAKLLRSKDAGDISESDLKAAAEAEMKNKSAIKEAFKAAKEDYKPST